MSSCFFGKASLLLPKKDLEKWAVIACDQYTSQPEYWEKVEELTVGAPSAAHMMLPEVKLVGSQADPAEIRTINETMKKYLEEGVFEELDPSYLYIERTQPDGRVRKGILGLIDLEQYDYHNGATSLIRATEQTVLERIPPRVAIRQDAPLEMPHLMLLADDEEMQLIEPLCAQKDRFRKVYDFDLMMGGGHIAGYVIDDSAAQQMNKVMEQFSDENAFRSRYRSDGAVLALAVGDGNHSLASAKECYEQVKAQLGEAALNHPARYALAEIVNLHDEALDFEPIYRLMKNCDLDELMNFFRKKQPSVHAGAAKPGEISFYFQADLERRTFSLKAAPGQLPIQVLQPILDAYLKDHPETGIDYVHGLETVRQLSRQEGCIAITFNGMEKRELFGSIVHGGVLPRKTFSMGCADDKRFYLECRKIR